MSATTSTAPAAVTGGGKVTPGAKRLRARRLRARRLRAMRPSSETLSVTVPAVQCPKCMAAEGQDRDGCHRVSDTRRSYATCRHCGARYKVLEVIKLSPFRMTESDL